MQESELATRARALAFGEKSAMNNGMSLVMWIVLVVGVSGFCCLGAGAAYFLSVVPSSGASP
jgi:hypothetical protein